MISENELITDLEAMFPEILEKLIWIPYGRQSHHRYFREIREFPRTPVSDVEDGLRLVGEKEKGRT
jgi:hypothetical protein